MRFREKKVKQNHAQNGSKRAAEITAGKNRRQQNGQKVYRDDIRVCESPMGEHPADRRCGGQESHRQRKIPDAWHVRTTVPYSVPETINLRIRNDVNIQLGCKLDQAFRQRRSAPKMTPPRNTASDDHSGHIGKPCVFHNLRRYVFTMGGDNFRTEPLRKEGIRLKARPIFCVHACGVGRLYI